MVVFKGMFDLLNKVKQKPLSEKVVMMRDALPVLSAGELLSTEKRQKILGEMQELLNLPATEYQRVFASVIENFALFIQNLPETERSYYASVGGWLDHALERAALSLFLCRTYLLPQENSLSSLSQQDMLWAYAVFTAALVYNIGRVVTRHVITLTDETGEPIREWLPFSGEMNGQATHYTFGFREGHLDHLQHMVTPLLARQILSIPAQGNTSSGEEESGEEGGEGGFNWIASDPEVLEAWLALLSDESRQVGSILTVVLLAEAQLLEGFLIGRKVLTHKLPPQIIARLAKLREAQKALKQAEKERQEKHVAVHGDKTPYDTQDRIEEKRQKYSLFGLGEREKFTTVAKQALSAVVIRETARDFTQWLRDQVQNGNIAVNRQDSSKANIYMTEKGVVIQQSVLQQFLKEQKSTEIKSIQDLEKILQTSEIARAAKASDPVATLQTVHKEGGALPLSLVINNPNLVFPYGAPPPMATVPPPMAVTGSPLPNAAPAEAAKPSPAVPPPFPLPSAPSSR